MCPHKKKPICARPFDQKLASSLIYFFYVHTTIRPNYMVLFHLFFLLRTTIRPRLRVLTDLFLLFAHDHSTKIQGPLSFILSFSGQPFYQKLGSALIYFLYLYTTIRQKYMVLFLFNLSFVHDHSIPHSFISFICTRPFDQII